MTNGTLAVDARPLALTILGALAFMAYRALTYTDCHAACVNAAAASDVVLLGTVAGSCGHPSIDNDLTTFVVTGAAASDERCCCIVDWRAYAMVPPGREHAACCEFACRSRRAAACIVSRHEATSWRACECDEL